MDNPFETLNRKLIKIEETLTFITTKLGTTKKPEKELGSIELAEEITGLSKSTLYRLTSTRAIPHLKKNGKLFFKRDELEKWLEEGRQDTFEDIKAKIGRKG